MCISTQLCWKILLHLTLLYSWSYLLPLGNISMYSEQCFSVCGVSCPVLGQLDLSVITQHLQRLELDVCAAACLMMDPAASHNDIQVHSYACVILSLLCNLRYSYCFFWIFFCRRFFCCLLTVLWSLPAGLDMQSSTQASAWDRVQSWTGRNLQPMFALSMI